MADSISYNTAKLVQVVPNLKRAQKFLLDRYFPNIVEADTEEIAIDVEAGKRRLAPLVSPLVQGKLVEQLGMRTNRFKPAYIKDKRAPDLRLPVKRMIGERLLGELSAAEREMMNLVVQMEDQVDMIDRRLEWMAAQALLTAKVTVAGEGYATTQVDFGRDPRLTQVLTGTDRWGVTLNTQGRDTNIVGQLTAFQALMLKASGVGSTDIIFTPSAWGKFLNADGVDGAKLFPALAPYGNTVNPGTEVRTGGVNMGQFGQFSLWLYNDWYVDDNDVEQPMLPDGYIIMTGPDLMGTRAFGLIYDPAFNYQPMAYAPKTWVSEDPAQRYLMMQSAPIVIPSRVNAAIAVKVC